MTLTKTREPRASLRQVREERWRGHGVLSALLRALVLVVPVLAGIVAGYAVSRIAGPRQLGMAGFFVVFAASTIAIIAVDLVTRRLLPLAVLLRLTLVFPDRAPSRMRLALRAGNMRRLRRWAEQEHASEAPSDAAQAAERVLSLVAALNAHDRRTRGHSERVRALVDVLADEMDLSEQDRVRLRWSALLHDLGKLSVSAAILNKPGKPTAVEWEALTRHPREGVRMAGPLAEWLGAWSGGIDEHHERWDGDGYPYGKAGTEISLAGRIVAVADAFECMTEVRSYQQTRSFAKARVELTRCAGSQFDPAVVRTLHGISLGRLHWALGPVSWVAQVPFIGALPRTAAQLANVSATSSTTVLAQVAAAAALVATPVPAAAATAIPGLGSLAEPSAAAGVLVVDHAGDVDPDEGGGRDAERAAEEAEEEAEEQAEKDAEKAADDAERQAERDAEEAERAAEDAERVAELEQRAADDAERQAERDARDAQRAAERAAEADPAEPAVPEAAEAADPPSPANPADPPAPGGPVG